MKRRRLAGGGRCSGGERGDPLDCLPDDVVLAILCKLSASAARPSDFVGVLVTCKRFNRLGLDPSVLSKASAGSLAVSAQKWCDSAHRFLEQCIDAGNLEASYILGMIQFYCLGNRQIGVSLITQATIGNHAAALYSLAVIRFNGSGGGKSDKDFRAGVAHCSQAASLGHVNALLELAHGCVIHRGVVKYQLFFLQANSREHATRLIPLLRDGWCSTPDHEPHPANRFMVEWFAATGSVVATGELLRLCSRNSCGRPETRPYEFRLCSDCRIVRYCSRACQVLHWELGHKDECYPVIRWLDAAVAGPGAVPPFADGG